DRSSGGEEVPGSRRPLALPSTVSMRRRDAGVVTMKASGFRLTALSFTLVLCLGASSDGQELPKRGTYTGKFIHPGATAFKVIEAEKDHTFFQGLAEGVFLNDAGLKRYTKS